MFKFNFSQSKDENSENAGADNTESKNDLQWFEAKEVIVRDEHMSEIHKLLSSTEPINQYKRKEIILNYLSTSCLKTIAEKINLVKPEFYDNLEQNHTDLISAKYEGEEHSFAEDHADHTKLTCGLKVWECTFDLLQYLIDEKVTFDKHSVLDLGCGSGLLGIYAYKNGSNVYFQDYNEEVLHALTIPNLLLNTSEISPNNRCKFYSGDWKHFDNLIQLTVNVKFDVILTSETIYNVDNYEKLFLIFANRLKPSGVVYLTAKTVYFGVGGGVREFEKFLAAKNMFDVRVAWKFENGLAREILEIRLI